VKSNPWVDFINICIRLFCPNVIISFHWRKAFCKWHTGMSNFKEILAWNQITLLSILGESIVGKIERRNFHKTLCVGVFLHGANFFGKIDPSSLSVCHCHTMSNVMVLIPSSLYNPLRTQHPNRSHLVSFGRHFYFFLTFFFSFHFQQSFLHFTTRSHFSWVPPTDFILNNDSASIFTSAL